MSKSTTVAISIVVLVVAVAGAFFVVNNSSSNQASNEQSSSATTNQTDAQSNESSSDTSGKSYSAAEVAVHNSATDCWTIISGKVYNISSYVDKHDGGDEILRACGIDGTTLFTERKTSSGEEVGTGTPHSASAQDQLSKLVIGDLKVQ